MRVNNIVVTLLAAMLVIAACEREESAPRDTRPALDRSPATTPAQELPAADTTTPAAAGRQPGQPGGAASGPSSGAASGGGSASAGTPSEGAGRPPRSGAAAPSRPASTQPAARAQQPPPASQDDGATVLQRASSAYANIRSLKADFVMQYTNPLLRQQTTSRGTLYQRRPDRIALRFTDPAGDVILSDGQFYWIYYPSVDAQQVIRCPTSEGGEQGVDLQAQFVGDPVRRFRYTLHGQESVGGRSAHVLTLEPRERVEYRALKVWLDTRDSLARRFEITEQNNTVRRFDLSDFEVNVGIPDATFRFTPPANARIVSCS
jgi:outer membrane lipoprotein-sorting protein